MNQSSISQNFISLKRDELSRKWCFGRKVQKGHAKGHKGQGQFGLAVENAADDPKYNHVKLYTFTALCVIVMTERIRHLICLCYFY